MGLSTNDVTATGVGGQGFYDDSTKALLLESVAMGRGVKNCQKLCDVIYWQPLWQKPIDVQWTI